MTSQLYDDFEADQAFLRQGRTITETDLTMYPMLTSDWNLIHNNAEHAASSKVG